MNRKEHCENKYTFVGMMIPEEDYANVLKNSKGSMQEAANVLQWHLYNGLCCNLDAPIHIITALPIHSWPKFYKKLFIKERFFESQYSTKNVSIGFFNLKAVNTKSKRRRIYHSLLKWCESKEGEKTIFVYTLSGVFLEPIFRIKKLYPEIKVCAIVADLPTMSNLSSKISLGSKIFDRIHTSSFEKYGDCVDYYVLLTKHMADYLHIEKPYCVMEGISTSSTEFGGKSSIENEKKVIFYSGTLHKRFGVLNLIEAFKNIPYDNYRLVLCGVGDCEDEIRLNAIYDKRILFLGQVSRQEALRYQKNATVVINPRQNVEEFCKYSFPSKNLEYMSSGTPLIAYKLDGIPDEYDEYIYYVKDNTIVALTERLIEVCEYPSNVLEHRGECARKFVQNNKNELVQTKKIIELIRR